MTTFKNVRRRLAQFVRGGACLEELTGEQRRDMWPPAPTLELRHLRNCRMFPDRTQVLEHMPAGAVCGEIGILRCDFSEEILRITKPAKLCLFDISEHAIAIARRKFAAEIAQGKVELRHGDSAVELERLQIITLTGSTSTAIIRTKRSNGTLMRADGRFVQMASSRSMTMSISEPQTSPNTAWSKPSTNSALSTILSFSFSPFRAECITMWFCAASHHDRHTGLIPPS
jgi:hypothetical protein